MTNAEFIVRLRKAKKIAMNWYPDESCILYACSQEFNLPTGWIRNSCTFVWPDGKRGESSTWVINHCKSPADIALVFDNSIADRQREIEKGNP